MHHFPKTYKPPPSSMRQKGDISQVSNSAQTTLELEISVFCLGVTEIFALRGRCATYVCCRRRFGTACRSYLLEHFKDASDRPSRNIPEDRRFKKKTRVQFVQEEAAKAQRGSRGIALLFLRPRR